MKNRTIATLILTVCLIGVAQAYYPGETKIFPNEMGIDNLVYTVVNNHSAIGNFTVDINSTNIIITFPMDMPPNSFDIVFIEEQTKEVIVTIDSGSGGSSTRYVYRNNTIYEDRDIETIVTQYVDKEVTVEVPGETIYETTGSRWWFWVILVFLGLGIFILGAWFESRSKT